MAVVATNLKKGNCIKASGDMGIILNLEHRTPGKGNALIMATIRSLQTGKTKAIRFASDEKVEVIPTDRQKLEYSYPEGDIYNFMDLNTYETIGLAAEIVGDTIDWLKEGQEIEVLFVDGNAVSVELPTTIVLEVTEAPEGLKGDTANNPTKAVTLETGKVIQAPLFIKPGDLLKVNVEEGAYVGRA